MPTYEYTCDKCGNTLDAFHAHPDDAPQTVPCVNMIMRRRNWWKRCEGTCVRQISGGGGVIFKGSGFYCNDYGRKGGKNDADHAVEEAK